MPTIHIKAELSGEELLRAVEQLSQPELERFVSQVVALQAQRRAPRLPEDEAELLRKINQGVPPDVQARYDELIAKRRASTLATTEHEELVQLTDQIEQLEADRLELLVELASLRKTSLSELMEALGIQPPPYG